MLQELAWLVWHDEVTFWEMRREVACDLEPAGNSTNMSQREAWFNWLVKAPEGVSCNLHLLWLWYYRVYISPKLSPV